MKKGDKVWFVDGSWDYQKQSMYWYPEYGVISNLDNGYMTVISYFGEVLGNKEYFESKEDCIKYIKDNNLNKG